MAASVGLTLRWDRWTAVGAKTKGLGRLPISSSLLDSSITLPFLLRTLAVALFLVWFAPLLCASEGPNAAQMPTQSGSSGERLSPSEVVSGAPVETGADLNRRLRDRLMAIAPTSDDTSRDYQIGPEDVLGINVFEAPEMNREVRVSASGEISLPLLESVEVAGLTPRQLETALQQLLCQKYMKDPHVSVFVHEMQSHPVSVMGAVRKPGVFQIRGAKPLLEVLSMAEGLTDDAGESVIILRGAGFGNAPEPASPKFAALAQAGPVPGGGALERTQKPSSYSAERVVQVNLKDLLDSASPHGSPEVYPGDIVKVSRAGVVYVVGAVRRPGGFTLKTNENISVLQALALSEGLTPTASHRSARIIHTDEQLGTRTELPCNLGKILAGKLPDPMLGPRDILFIPDSATKSTLSRSFEAAVQTLTGLLIFHW